jgi:hypothetical protein
MVVATYPVPAHKRAGARFHHTEKAELIHRLLKGRSGLRIFEPCAYQGDGKPGVCSRAYSDYADPLQHRRLGRGDGDWMFHIRLSLLRSDKYDVVDLDSYGDPSRPLWSGVSELIDDGGLLFLTFPIVSHAHRFPHPRSIVEGAYGCPKPGASACIGNALRALVMYQCHGELVGIASHDSVLRVALRCTRIARRMRDVRLAVRNTQAFSYAGKDS